MKEVQLTLKKLRRNEITVEEATKVIDKNYITREEHKYSLVSMKKKYNKRVDKRITDLEAKVLSIKRIILK